MRSPFEFQVLHSSIESEAINLGEFARSFDHEIQEAYPIIVLRREGQIRAYVQLERRTLATPAISPLVNSPRDTLEAATAFMGFMRQMRPGFLLQGNNEKFTDTLVEKMGVRRWPYTIYSPI